MTNRNVTQLPMTAEAIARFRQAQETNIAYRRVLADVLHLIRSEPHHDPRWATLAHRIENALEPPIPRVDTNQLEMTLEQ